MDKYNLKWACGCVGPIYCKVCRDREYERAKELAETVAMRFGIEPVPGQEIQSVLYYLRQLPTNDDGVYLGLVGHKPGELMKEQEFGQFFYSDGKDLLGYIGPRDENDLICSHCNGAGTGKMTIGCEWCGGTGIECDPDVLAEHEK